MKKQTNEDRLVNLIKEAGIEEPSTEFSQRLVHQIIAGHAYQRSYNTAPYKKQAWIGRVIIIALLALNAYMLVKLNPFQAQPVLCWALGAFILVFFCIVFAPKKNQAFGRQDNNSGILK